MSKSPTPPNPLYKYTCLAAVEELCRNRGSRWAAPRTFNDPFDMQRDMFIRFGADEFADSMSQAWESVVFGDRDPPEVDPLQFFRFITAIVTRLGLSREQFRGRNREFLAPRFESMLQTLRQETEYWRDWSKRARVFCLSATKSHLTMWAHYAKSHEGAVIAFRGVPELDSSWLAAHPIAYVDRLPEWLSAEEFANRSVSGEFDGMSMFRDQMYTKSADWSYEQEWRVCKLLDEDDGAEFWHNQVLEREVDSIYFGCRTRDVEIDRLRALIRVNFPKCKVFRGRRSDREYVIDFEQLDGPS